MQESFIIHLAEPVLDTGGLGAFFRAYFLKKEHFCLLAHLKQISFLTISNKNIFFKTHSTRLDAIVAPNKDLEYALSSILLKSMHLSQLFFHMLIIKALSKLNVIDHYGSDLKYH